LGVRTQPVRNRKGTLRGLNTNSEKQGTQKEMSTRD